MNNLIKRNTYINLADLGYLQVLPRPELRPFIQCFWIMQRNELLPIYREEFMHPDGGSGVIFNFGDPFYHNGRYINQAFVFDGRNTKTVRLGLQGKVNALGVHFNPGGAFALFSKPVHRLISDYRTIMRDINLIYNDALHANSLVDRVAIVESWLLQQLKNSDGLNSFVNVALELIKTAQGQAPISEVLETVYISQRQLERLFDDHVGMTPKKYSGLMRVRNAREKLKQIKIMNMADVAYSAGFFDQAHFIREFKTIVGLSPKAYMLRNQRKGI